MSSAQPAYLIDADVVIEALAGRQRAVDTLARLAPSGIAISLITVGEIYDGAYRSSDPPRLMAEYRRFLQPFAVLGLSDPIMERFAQVRALLARRGEIIPDFDILMGVTAVHHGLILLTYNIKHLRRIPGIQIHQDRPRGTS